MEELESFELSIEELSFEELESFELSLEELSFEELESFELSLEELSLEELDSFELSIEELSLKELEFFELSLEEFSFEELDSFELSIEEFSLKEEDSCWEEVFIPIKQAGKLARVNMTENSKNKKRFFIVFFYYANHCNQRERTWFFVDSTTSIYLYFLCKKIRIFSLYKIKGKKARGFHKKMKRGNACMN